MCSAPELTAAKTSTAGSSSINSVVDKPSRFAAGLIGSLAPEFQFYFLND